MGAPKAPSSSEEGVGGGGVSPETLRARAARLRRDMPEPERRLWQELRGSSLGGFKFRRQVVIGNRIVDFFCPAKGLVIEVDGDTHDPATDADRDAAMLRDHRFPTVRFTNDQIMRNLDGVLEKLKSVLDETADRWPSGSNHHPQTPSSEEEGAF
ncbi:MAG: endonuclease domain-containing protein [Erythrobacter sp.]|uniref:endonuclease domain-containing protein n=1 Tax=Erythrobacter sp. TaxID=1042 RepID=UPI001B2C7933|nr:endonuclease domain-containing protein [Erythrobacter sp.]MBO6769442.1 endonuclease domain-containing protein [Erythrobacter sp.]